MAEEEGGLVLSLPDATSTEALGARLRALGDDALVLLEGDLGAGKTTLVRGFLREAGHAGPVRSPTYTLLEPYEMGTLVVLHFDLYRLGDPEELEDLGVRDHFAGRAWRFLEWPDRAGDLLPPEDLRIRLGVSGEGRRAEVSAATARGRTWIDRLRRADR